MNIDQVVDEIINKINITDTKTIKNISIRQILLELLINDNVKDAAIELGITENVLEHYCNRVLKKVFHNKISKTKWQNFLLSIVSVKVCNSCLGYLSTTSFYKDSSRSDGYNYVCKICTDTRTNTKRKLFPETSRNRSRRHYLNNIQYYLDKSRNRKEAIKLATVAWSEKDKIAEFYANTPNGCEVDHIVPLKGVMVCGLHVMSNLQYLTKEDNRNKSNKFTGTLAESA